MMSNELIGKIVGLVKRLTIKVLIKFALVILSFFYIFFALALWRQVQLMSSVVEVGDVSILRLLGLIHLLASIAVFVLAFILI